MWRVIVQTFGIWLSVTLVLILVVLIPRGNHEVDRSLSREEQMEQYEEGITDFSWEAYGNNVTTLIQYAWKHKSLGETIHTHSVEYEVWRYLKKSMWLIVPSFILSSILGVLKGIYDFYVKHRKLKFLGEKTTVFFLSVPDFFLLLMIQVALITLAHYGFPRISLYGSEEVSNKIVGIVFLAIYPTFYIARLTYSSLEQQSNEDYIRTALSKGTHRFKIIWTHMLSNCWLAITSHLNTIMLYILSNLFIVELITSYRGAAYRFYKALHVRGSFTVGSPQSIDTSLVIEYIIVFTGVLLIVQLFSKLAAYQLLRRGGSSS
ncbi:ABC transporter permease subunit [Pontibacillus chungwhensis]|nr:ABC transporter permease [Pontibacillus chungwhensis]